MDAAQLALLIVKKFLTKKGEDYIKKHFTSINLFQSELASIIDDTHKQFLTTHSASTGDKIAFYESQTVVEELLTFSFFVDFDFTGFETKVASNNNFLPTTSQEISDFFELFKSNISKNKSLKQLEVEFTYKDKIFKIQESINQLSSVLQRTVRELDDSLNQEYHRQLQEIKENIRSFQPSIALRRLASLSDAIITSGHMQDALQARIYYLQALCHEDLDSDHSKKNELFIKAYKHRLTDPDYKIRAALGYLSLNEPSKSLELAESILVTDEFNSVAWLIKTILSKSPLEDNLAIVPSRVVAGKTYIPMLYHWFLNKNSIPEMQLLGKQYLNPDLIRPTLPTKISYETKDYWFFISLINIKVYYKENTLLSLYIDRQVCRKNQHLIYLNDCLKLISSTFTETEIAAKYSVQIFYGAYLNFIFDESQFSLSHLEAAYKRLSFPVSANAMALLQVLVSIDKTSEAISYIDQFESVEGLQGSQFKSLTQCLLYKGTGDSVKALQSLKKYLTYTKEVDEMALSNILSQAKALFKNKEEAYEFKAHIHDDANFQNVELKRLFDLFWDASFLRELSDNALSIEFNIAKKQPFDISLKYFIAVALYNCSRIDESIDFCNSFIDKENADAALYFYIKCLIESKNSDKIELIRLLKWWRNNVGLDIRFVNAEIYHRQYIEDWEEIRKITQACKIEFKDEPHFTMLELLALERIGDTNEIKKMLPEIVKIDFRNEKDTINVYAILAKNKFFDEAIAVLYASAVSPNNKRSRQQYVSNLTVLPDSLFVEYDEVKNGMFVKYSMDEKVKYIEIAESTTTEFEGKFLGRKIGDHFLIPENMGLGFKKIIVVRIMNKYLSLMDQIIEDSDDPVSGIKMKKIETTGDDPQEFHKSLLKNFGAEGTMRKRHIDDELKAYYNGITSFTEVTASVFGNNFLDSYTFLTSNGSEGFLTLPSVFCDKTKAHNRFILDPSSVVLFYDLYIEYKWNPNEKYFISPFLVQFLKDTLTGLELSPPSKMTLSITMDGIIPYFYSDDFKQKSIDYLAGLCKWLDECTQPLLLDKRINFNSVIDQEDRDSDLPIRVFVDVTLGLENGYTLVTSDYFYFRQFPQFKSSIISPQFFIEHQDSFDKKAATAFLLSKHYIGINLSEEVFMEEWIKDQAKKDNYYRFCLRNVDLAVNPNDQIINTVVGFLKKVYLTNWNTYEDKSIACQMVFFNLVRSIPKNDALLALIKTRISQEFKLMGVAQNLVLNEFDKVVAIVKR